MLLNQTTIGELYQSLSAEELKELELYIRRQTQGKSSILYQLHRLMKDAKAQGKLGELDYNYIKAELFDHSPSGTTKLTTYTHLLINQIKEFLLLSKIKEKNIYTETLWGEILIERRLKRSLLLKTTNNKFDFYKCQYPYLKEFFSKREEFFYNYSSFTKKNYEVILLSLREKISAFNDYSKYQNLEMYTTYYSLTKQSKRVNLKEFEDIISLADNVLKQDSLLSIQALIFLLTVENKGEYYSYLVNLFFSQFSKLSKEYISQIVSTLLNFGQNKINNGDVSYEYENYKLLKFLFENHLLFTKEFFTIIRYHNFIVNEVKFGDIKNAEVLLNEHIHLVVHSQKNSFNNLLSSKIEFAKGYYKEALRHISSMNPSDSLYFFPQYKIMLIKCHVMLEDIDRVQAEKDNFYKYIYNNKNIPEDAQRRHKLFIKYAEYLIDARYEFLTDYMRRRIEKALLPSSPYFTEKPWMQERWNQLKEKYQK